MRRAVPARPRDCTLCRECVREPAWEDRVLLERVTDHFIFSVESTGALPARTLVQEAVKILADKCRTVLQALGGEEPGADADLPPLSEARSAIFGESTMRSSEEDADD